MRYPIVSATSIPNSGNALYLYLIENLSVPARMSHQIWYTGCQKMVDSNEEAFQGFFPVGKTLKMSYAGGPMGDYTFTGGEKNPVFVRDLSPEAKLQLGISGKAKDSEKVFNPFFLPYDDLPEKTKKDNELPALSLAKSICAFLSSDNILFTEKNVADMLMIAIRDANSNAMRTILHGNHVAWCAARFMTFGTLEEDVKKNFYGQNDINFYVKDIGTIMPPMLYTLALIGVNPVEAVKELDYDLYGIEAAAVEMQQFMYINKAQQNVA
jgi:hypothetical protein